VFADVTNSSGALLEEVTVSPLAVTGSGEFVTTSGPAPAVDYLVPADQTAFFRYRGFAIGSVQLSATATALSSDGSVLTGGPWECGAVGD
jgi:hypothetical protein